MKTLTTAQTAMINVVIALAIMVPAKQDQEFITTQPYTQYVLVSVAA